MLNSKVKSYFNLVVLVIAGMSLFLVEQALAAFQVPALTGPVVDLAKIIERSDQRELAQLLQDYNQQGKAQIQVLTVPSLQGDAIESVSIQVADAWKLGGEKSDNGILFIIATEDRKLRIEVGQGLEGAMPDAYARRVIDDVVVPMFRAGRVSDGVVVGVHQIITIIDKEYAAGKQLDKPAGKSKVGLLSQLGILFFLLIVAGIGRMGGGGAGLGRYDRRGYGGGFPTGGWGGGSGGGGGGWSGGGGGFSGGGSSGSW